MNDNAKKWVEALRSGNYSQGKGALRRGDKFCCLGVACDISLDELGLGVTQDNLDGSYIYEGNSAYLPHPVLSWLDMREGAQDMLASMNDAGATFEAIAKYIENEIYAS